MNREQEVIARLQDDHDMHEFYCGMLEMLCRAAQCYLTVAPIVTSNRVTQDARHTLVDAIAEVSFFLETSDSKTIEVKPVRRKL